MKKSHLLTFGILLALVVMTPTALASPSENLSVPKTTVTIIIDSSLNMTSEWNGSAVVLWLNPIDGTERESVYMLHNDTHYLFGAILYDPDNIADDSFTIYVKWDNVVYKYTINEGSTTITLVNITNGEETLTSNATAIMTSSHPAMSWLYLELAIPKDEWNNSTEAYLYFEHIHTFKLTITSRYPENANPEDPTTWLHVIFKEVLGQYQILLTFSDRDGKPIDYIADRSYAKICFLNGTVYTMLAPSGSLIKALLPAENYTISFYVYDMLIFNTTLNVNTNITASYTLNNLNLIATPLGDIVAVVELPGQVEAMYLDPERRLGLVITNNTKPTALRIFPRVVWNYSFVVALNTLNFTYNPYTNALIIYISGNLSGVMMIGAPKTYPVFHYSNGTIRGYVFNHELEDLSVWLSNGSYKIFYAKAPFAIALNNTALKKGTDYSTNALNITTLSIEGGELKVFFKNPIKASLTVSDTTAKIYLATPYRFTGRYTIKIWRGTELVATRSGTFTSSVPLTTIDIPLGTLEPDVYMIEATVTDDDSKQTVATTSLRYEVEAQAPEEEKFAWENYYLLIPLLMLLLLLIIVITLRKSIVQIEGRRKFIVLRK